MRIIDFPKAAKILDAVLDSVVADREPAVITRQGRPSVVLVAASDWEIVQQRIVSAPAKSDS